MNKDVYAVLDCGQNPSPEWSSDERLSVIREIVVAAIMLSEYSREWREAMEVIYMVTTQPSAFLNENRPRIMERVQQ